MTWVCKTVHFGLGAVFFALTVVGSANARAWNEQVLYSFTGGVDGQQPWAGVTLDGAGNIYGAVT
ncbi:MAG TPA: hypothetical protein VLC74_04665, partial [Rhizomicrobium sp.]|nr:hypothetical protein [Rhizomicrobium sp.]